MRRALTLYVKSLKQAFQPPLLWSVKSTMAGFSVMLGAALVQRVALFPFDPGVRSAALLLLLLVFFVTQSVIVVVAVHTSVFAREQREEASQ